MNSSRQRWLGVLTESLRLIAQWLVAVTRPLHPLAGRIWGGLRTTWTRLSPATGKVGVGLVAFRAWSARTLRSAGQAGARALPHSARLARRAVALWPLGMGATGGAAALLAGGGVVLYRNCGVDGCPDVQLLTVYQPGGAPVLLDRNGERFADLAPFERVVVSIDSLPEHVYSAFTAVEDQRFWRHNGVDWRRVAGAAVANLRFGGIAQGSSTIPMQLARNVFPEELPGSERTMKRKIEEMRVAQKLEGRFEKEEILEMYLNHIYFGGGAYGIEAASRLYFGKSASQLSVAEAATLAALPKAPSHYDPRRRPERSVVRRDLVIGMMERQQLIDSETAASAKATALTVTDGSVRDRSGVPLGAYFIDIVRGMLEDHFGEQLYRSRLHIYTTLDANAQQAAESELEAQLRALDARVRAGPGELQGSVVLLEAHTGHVLALVGGRDPTTSRYNRAHLAQRQLGSSFKPFVFAAALDEGIPASRVLSDAPLRMEISRTDVWQPSNYDGQFEGSVSFRNALVRSRNVPTVRLASEVGIGDVAQTARLAGVRAVMDETPSLSLGTVAMSPLQLATAYTTFATLGNTSTPHFVLRVEDESGKLLWEPPVTPPVRGMDARVAYVITDILQDAVDRGTGTGVRSAGYRGPVAGKTGTTNNATDTWFVGYTPDVVGAVWIGYDQPSPMGGNATGGGFAAPVWGRVMRQLYTERPMPALWTMPDGISHHRIDPFTGLRLQEGCEPNGGSATSEMFITEHLPPTVCPQRDFWGDMWNRIRGREREIKFGPMTRQVPGIGDEGE